MFSGANIVGDELANFSDPLNNHCICFYIFPNNVALKNLFDIQ